MKTSNTSDIENNKYKGGNDVFKTTNKKRQLLKNKIYTNYNKIIHNGEFQKSLKNIERNDR